MTYDLIIAISPKTGKPYAYIDLGYRREFLKLEIVAELTCQPVARLYCLNEEVKHTLEIK